MRQGVSASPLFFLSILELYQDFSLHFSCVFPGFVYESEKGSRAVSLGIDKASLVDVTKDQVLVYYHGGCSFEVEEAAGNPADSKVLAWYNDQV